MNQTLQEMVAVVTTYINHRKGVNVDINLQQFQNPMNVLLLQQAYSTAVNWFTSNNGSINFL